MLFKYANKINSYIIISSLLMVITAVIFMLNKGYDFSDEGALLLGYENIDEYNGGVLNHHLIVHHLFNWLAPNVITYRIINILLLTSSSFFLYRGVRNWINYKWTNSPNGINGISLFCLVLLSVFIYYFLGFHTVSYNSFIHVSLVIFTGILLEVMTDYNFQHSIKFKNYFLLIFLGFIIGFCFFIKFSTSILLFFVSISILTTFICSKKKYTDILIVIGLISFGVICFFSLYFQFVQSFRIWQQNFVSEMSFLSTHRPITLVLQYVSQINHFVIFFLKYFSWIILVLLIRFKLKNRSLNFLVLTFAICFFLFELYYFKFFQSTYAIKPWYNAYLYLCVIIYSLLYLGIKFIMNRGKIANIYLNLDFYIFLLFIVTPLLGALGTANPIFLNCLWHGTTWILLAFYFTYQFYIITKRKILLFLFYILIMITSSQIIDGNLFHPYFSISYNYGLPNDGFDQKYEIANNRKLRGILVDKDTKEVVEKLSQIYKVNKFGKKVPTIGFFMPGLIYAVDGLSPYSYYYFNLPRDAVAIEKSKFDNLVLLVTDAIPIGEDIKNALHKKGIEYPEDFTLIDSLIYYKQSSYLKVYKLEKNTNEY